MILTFAFCFSVGDSDLRRGIGVEDAAEVVDEAVAADAAAIRGTGIATEIVREIGREGKAANSRDDDALEKRICVGMCVSSDVQVLEDTCRTRIG